MQLIAVIDKVCIFAAIELGQGEFGSVLKGTWRAPSGELVQTSCHLSVFLPNANESNNRCN